MRMSRARSTFSAATIDMRRGHSMASPSSPKSLNSCSVRPSRKTRSSVVRYSSITLVFTFVLTSSRVCRRPQDSSCSRCAVDSCTRIVASSVRERLERASSWRQIAPKCLHVATISSNTWPSIDISRISFMFVRCSVMLLFVTSAWDVERLRTVTFVHRSIWLPSGIWSVCVCFVLNFTEQSSERACESALVFYLMVFWQRVCPSMHVRVCWFVGM